MEIISLLHAGNSTLDTWIVLVNQEIKMFPPHTPRHTAISILLYLHVHVRGLYFSLRREIQLYSELFRETSQKGSTCYSA